MVILVEMDVRLQLFEPAFRDHIILDPELIGIATSPFGFPEGFGTVIEMDPAGRAELLSHPGIPGKKSMLIGSHGPQRRNLAGIDIDALVVGQQPQTVEPRRKLRHEGGVIMHVDLPIRSIFQHFDRIARDRQRNHPIFFDDARVAVGRFFARFAPIQQHHGLSGSLQMQCRADTDNPRAQNNHVSALLFITHHNRLQSPARGDPASRGHHIKRDNSIIETG